MAVVSSTVIVMLTPRNSSTGGLLTRLFRPRFFHGFRTSMKIKLNVAIPIYTSVKSFFGIGVDTPLPPENLRSRGEGLAKLHEYQHQVILGLFRINIAGLVAFLLIVLSFTLFTLSDPNSPKWIGVMMISVATLLLLGCFRTVKEFNHYRKHYTSLMAQLQSKLQKYFSRPQSEKRQGGVGKGRESRVLSVLKPKEHKGWDARDCENCHKSIELLASVCQHCGHEQESLLKN